MINGRMINYNPIPNQLEKILSYIFPFSVEQKKGEISPYLEVSLYCGKYKLNAAKVNYSYGGLHYIFDEVFNKIQIKEKKIKNALILGFGAGSVACLLTEKYNQNCMITGVEKDAEVIQLAHKYFNITRFKKLELIHADASDFVSMSTLKFDLIIVDVFVEDNVPKKFHQLPFIQRLDELLSENGILIFNKVINNSDHKNEMKLVSENINNTMGKCVFHDIVFSNTKNSVLIFDRKKSTKNYPLDEKYYDKNNTPDSLKIKEPV